MARKSWRTTTASRSHGRPEPLTYYHRELPDGAGDPGPCGRARGARFKVAVIGLGAGSLACYVEPGETWRFFEIDPSVVDIARDPQAASPSSQSCAPELPIVLGDARLTLAREPDGHFDLIIVDAYSSDAIPIHLATREAMAHLQSEARARRRVMMHVSNRHLELASVVSGIAAANGMMTWLTDDAKAEEKDERDDEYIFTSTVAISATERAHIGQLADSPDWQLAEPDKTQRLWTDDYSNIVGAIWRKLN